MRQLHVCDALAPPALAVLHEAHGAHRVGSKVLLKELAQVPLLRLLGQLAAEHGAGLVLVILAGAPTAVRVAAIPLVVPAPGAVLAAPAAITAPPAVVSVPVVSIPWRVMRAIVSSPPPRALQILLGVLATASRRAVLVRAAVLVICARRCRRGLRRSAPPRLGSPPPQLLVQLALTRYRVIRTRGRRRRACIARAALTSTQRFLAVGVHGFRHHATSVCERRRKSAQGHVAALLARAKKWTRRDLNPRPTAITLCKAGVVTTPPRAPKS